MSQQGMTIVSLEGGLCCADSQSVTIFSSGSRTGTEVEFLDTKQSEKSYYFIDYESGTGSADIVLQVLNEITSNWEDVFNLGTFSSVGESLVTGTSIQPDNSLSRIQITTTGTWTGSVGVTLVDPKFK